MITNNFKDKNRRFGILVNINGIFDYYNGLLNCEVCNNDFNHLNYVFSFVGEDHKLCLLLPHFGINNHYVDICDEDFYLDPRCESIKIIYVE